MRCTQTQTTYTYRTDLYYINHRLGGCERCERVVHPWYWWLIALLAGRRYERFKNFHVLYEPDPTRGHWSE